MTHEDSCDSSLARENQGCLFLQSLLIGNTLFFIITAAYAKSENRAVLVLRVLVCNSLPCCPTCPASCGLSWLSLGVIRHFPVRPTLKPLG